MKVEIDWSKAPEWANYWAMDDIGSANWHEKKPRLWNVGNGWSVTWHAFGGEAQEAPDFSFQKKEFRDSLRCRPSIPSPAELNTMDCKGGE